MARVVAIFSALGEAWDKTAPPVRLVGWAFTVIVTTALLSVAQWASIVPPFGIETLLRLVRLSY